MLGVSRSSSLILAYLMKYENMNLRMAYDHVLAFRPCVRPNKGFWFQLTQLEKYLQQSDRSGVVPYNILSQTTLNRNNKEWRSSPYTLKPIKSNTNQFYRTYSNNTLNYSQPIIISDSPLNYYSNEYQNPSSYYTNNLQNVTYINGPLVF